MDHVATVKISQGTNELQFTFTDIEEDSPGDAALEFYEFMEARFKVTPPYEPTTICLTGGPFSYHSKQFK